MKKLTTACSTITPQNSGSFHLFGLPQGVARAAAAIHRLLNEALSASGNISCGFGKLVNYVININLITFGISYSLIRTRPTTSAIRCHSTDRQLVTDEFQKSKAGTSPKTTAVLYMRVPRLSVPRSENFYPELIFNFSIKKN